MSGPAFRDLPPELATRLNQLKQRLRLLAAARGLATTLAVTLSLTCAGLLVDLLWELPLTVRYGLLAGTAGSAVVLFLLLVLRPLFRKYSATELAAIVEQANPRLRERILCLVELSDPDVPESEKGSPLMRSLLERQAIRQAAGVDFAGSVSTRRALRLWTVVATLCVLLVVPVLWSPGGYGLLWARWLTPWEARERAGNLWFEISPQEAVVARGSSVSIQAEPRFRRNGQARPEEVWLDWQDAAGESDSRRMTWDDQAGVFLGTRP
ncbi:MAG: hypothetical protein KDA79_10290, partial [Planctomycetaceae bacterium]|nr:hypothetical protein [Planctomycetaceae bacterium]